MLDQRSKIPNTFVSGLHPGQEQGQFCFMAKDTNEASSSKLSVPFLSPVSVNTYLPFMLIVNFSLFNNIKYIQYFVS